MASGTVTGELNRLANGGATYPSPLVAQGEAAAANAWAGTSGLETVGALNVKAGNTVGNYRGMAGVCNQLAGTVGLAPPAALAAIPS